MYDVGTEGDGGVAKAVCDSDHSPAIDWSVLDRGLRHSRRSWFRSVSGECPGDEELTRAQKRRAGESMADEAAHLMVCYGTRFDPLRKSARCGPIGSSAMI